MFRVPGSFLRYKKCDSCFESFSFHPRTLKFYSETGSKTPLKIEADYKTETSPEPRVSVFRVLDESLGKLWYPTFGNIFMHFLRNVIYIVASKVRVTFKIVLE